ncbi:hypothetical protein PISMIDRAFT_680090 [Pisolithus microcarpus 441]|uniref:Uncharacterized protein n=1 Tax=Pisolithus microcarpus 441 TaxID=765257 RepID=A0A0C9YCN0_9AGAM|nr:hypothetical protein PISMIDRAFT_680090 [Pisolithus microcarpus 441]
MPLVISVVSRLLHDIGPLAVFGVSLGHECMMHGKKYVSICVSRSEQRQSTRQSALLERIRWQNPPAFACTSTGIFHHVRCALVLGSRTPDDGSSFPL